MSVIFDPCEICGNTNWQTRYMGKVRDGAFGNLSKEDCVVAHCAECGVERLNESACKDTVLYETEDYRRVLKEPVDAAGFLAEHDASQIRNLAAIWPESLRGKVIADIGCAAGSFIDHIKGLVREAIAVEPCKVYHEYLKARGYHVYAHIEDAYADWVGRTDFSFCFSVIEHIQNPKIFLKEICELLAPEGKLFISTPNRRDILMDLKGDEYKRFFYRSVHRWYFDVDSFIYCAKQAGLCVRETRCVHRFGLSNAMAWLREGRPTGSATLPYLDSPNLDNFWKSYLESRGVGDYLYIKLQRQA